MVLNFVVVLLCRLAESDAKDASERAVTAQDELDEGREAVFEAKRKVEEMQKLLERAKEALEAAEKKVKQAVLDVKATAKVMFIHYEARAISSYMMKREPFHHT
jgi:predicted  nucleic acid-binding Zn-ribbon protein